MYIAQVYNTLHDWWRYIIGAGVAIIGIFAFSMPHLIAIGLETIRGNVDESRLEDVNYLMGLFEPNLNLVFVLLPFVGGLFFLLIVVKYLHKQSLRMLTTAREKIDWKRFWFAFLFWGIVSTGMVLADYFLNPEGYVNNFNLQPFLILCVIAILLVPLQTSFEEYFFRGYLMQGIGISTANKYFPFVFIYVILVILGYFFLAQVYSLGFLLSIVYLLICIGLLFILLKQDFIYKLCNNNSYNKLFFLLKRNSTPLIITSLVFGLLHIANPEVDKLGYVILIYYIGTGFFLGITTLMDEGLELSLGFHAANNLFTALLVTADWTAFQTHSILKDISDPIEVGIGETILPVFILFPILLFIFSKKYKWTDWKDKLFGAVVKPVVQPVVEDVESLE